LGSQLVYIKNFYTTKTNRMAETEEQIPQTEPETITETSEETKEEAPTETEQKPQEENDNNTTESTEEIEFIRDPILDQEEMRKMFVGGIATDSTDEELHAFFEEISGGVVEDKVIIRKDTDKKSHFGFITFATSELVDEVLLKRDQLKFKDRALDVNRAVPKNNSSPGAHEKTKKLFIANLPKTNCSSEDLMKYFQARHPAKYGTIEKIQLIKVKDSSGNPTEDNKGFGFIVVTTEDLADKMAIQHSNFEFGGRKIELKKSVPNNEGRQKGGRGGNRGGGQMYGQQQQYGGYGYAYGGYPDASWGYAQYPGYGGYAGADYGGYGGGYNGPQAPAGRGRGGSRYRPY